MLDNLKRIAHAHASASACAATFGFVCLYDLLWDWEDVLCVTRQARRAWFNNNFPHPTLMYLVPTPHELLLKNLPVFAACFPSGFLLNPVILRYVHHRCNIQHCNDYTWP